jgi:tyrosyl-tRNA synthetase
MSKSLGNYVGVNDDPDNMFGKLMSISDTLMARYHTLLLGEDLPAGIHPMEAKKSLAARLVGRYHDEAAALAARQAFEARFSRKDDAQAEWPGVAIAPGTGLVAAVAMAYQSAYGETKSNGDIRRLIQQGSVQLDGEKLGDPKAEPAWTAGSILKLDKKRSVKLV